MVKMVLNQESLEEMLLRKLKMQTDDDGAFLYPAETEGDDEEERKGSALIQLVKYAVGKSNEKPIDYNLFLQFLVNVLKIPQSSLHVAPIVWQKLIT